MTTQPDTDTEITTYVEPGDNERKPKKAAAKPAKAKAAKPAKPAAKPAKAKPAAKAKAVKAKPAAKAKAAKPAKAAKAAKPAKKNASPKTPKEPRKRKESVNLVRIDQNGARFTPGWQVKIRTEKLTISKWFGDKATGGEAKGKAAAIKWRDEQLAAAK